MCETLYASTGLNVVMMRSCLRLCLLVTRDIRSFGITTFYLWAGVDEHLTIGQSPYIDKHRISFMIFIALTFSDPQLTKPLNTTIASVSICKLDMNENSLQLQTLWPS